ncbi:hypothetical protein EW026_g431 [Hermanssonia centrifuga]|uniref:Uncharacterized protein n=1 Tax=Hermanssonia centrifuga TaxID=98765 RepID=A0A4S4KZ43_9APHY|nr:hypothetical protein EW026_g431 [Hermanssonia centrifuga]
MGLSAASPNGSFVPGWTPHERMKPKGITKVTVHGCKRISEVELLSLQDEQFGVLHVQWKAW